MFQFAASNLSDESVVRIWQAVMASLTICVVVIGYVVNRMLKRDHELDMRAQDIKMREQDVKLEKERFKLEQERNRETDRQLGLREDL